MKYFILFALFCSLNASEEVSDKEKNEFKPCKIDGDCGERHICSLFKYCYRLNCMKQADCLKV
jgi:hypothetical protein